MKRAGQGRAGRPVIYVYIPYIRIFGQTMQKPYATELKGWLFSFFAKANGQVCIKRIYYMATRKGNINSNKFLGEAIAIFLPHTRAARLEPCSDAETGNSQLPWKPARIEIRDLEDRIIASEKRTRRRARHDDNHHHLHQQEQSVTLPPP